MLHLFSFHGINTRVTLAKGAADNVASMRTNHISRFTIALLSAAVLMTAVPRASAQGTEAALSGSVSDKSGSMVADATVTAKNEKTGETRSVKTNAEGVYRITNLKPSVYTIRAVLRSASAARIHRD